MLYIFRYFSPFPKKTFSDVTKDEFPRYIYICIKSKNLLG